MKRVSLRLGALASLVLAATSLSQGGLPVGATAPVASGPVAKLAPLVAEARVQARGWKADARLIGIFVKAGLDGRIDPANLVGPTNQNGGFAAFQFFSPTAGMVQSFGLEATGRVGPQGPPLPVGAATPSIPDRFMDLDAALAKAAEGGLRLPGAITNGFVDARLTPVHVEPGRLPAATWTITAIDTGGAYPMPAGEPVVLDAATGAGTTEEALSGRLERRTLAEELTRGRIHPATQRDYAFYRKEADGWAARWRPEVRLEGIAVSGRIARGGFEIDRATFAYFAPDPRGGGDPLATTIAVFPSEGSMLMRAEKLDAPIDGSRPRPVAAPDRFLSPESAAARLRALDAAIDADPIVLQLVFGGSLVEAAARSGGSVAPAPAGSIGTRWLWVSRAVRAVSERAGIFVYDRQIMESVAIDAVTGEPVKTADSRKAGAESRLAAVDPRIVGTWVGSPHPSLTVTFEILPTGAFKVRAGRGKVARETAATVDAAGGRWSIRDLDGQSYSGTYRLLDADTLEWVDPKDAAPVTLRRVLTGETPPGDGGSDSRK